MMSFDQLRAGVVYCARWGHLWVGPPGVILDLLDECVRLRGLSPDTETR